MAGPLLDLLWPSREDHPNLMAYEDVVKYRLARIDTAARKLSLDTQRVRAAVEHTADVSSAGFLAVDHRLAHVEQHVAASLAVQKSLLPVVVDELLGIGDTLIRIEDLVANPRKTAALEFRTDGVRLATRGLLEEATTELEQSIQVYAYDPVAHFIFANVSSKLECHERAARAFALVRRYSTDNRLIATAGLLEATSWQEAGHDDERLRSLESACEQVPDCAELWLVLGYLNGREALARALTLGPELVFDPSLTDLAFFAAACECALAAGHLEAGRASSAALRGLHDLVREAKLDVDSDPLSYAAEPSEADEPSLLGWCVCVEAEARSLLERVQSALSALPVPPAPPTPRRTSRHPITFETVLAVLAIVGVVTVIGVAIASAVAAGDPLGPVLSVLAGIGVAVIWLQPGDNLKSEVSYRRAMKAFKPAQTAHLAATARRQRLMEAADRIAASLSPVNQTRTWPLFLPEVRDPFLGLPPGA